MDDCSPAQAGVQGAAPAAPLGAPGPRPPPGNKVRFAGYAAIFDRPDRGGDVVRQGAFLGSLQQGGAVPLLWQHKAGAVIGRVQHLSEDRRGLRVIAELGEGEDAQRAGKLLKSGKLDGLMPVAGKLRLFGNRMENCNLARQLTLS